MSVFVCFCVQSIPAVVWGLPLLWNRNPVQEAAYAEGSRPQNMAQIHISDWDVSRETLMKTRPSKEWAGVWFSSWEILSRSFHISITLLQYNSYHVSVEIIFGLQVALYAEKFWIPCTFLSFSIFCYLILILHYIIQENIVLFNTLQEFNWQLYSVAIWRLRFYTNMITNKYNTL